MGWWNGKCGLIFNLRDVEEEEEEWEEEEWEEEKGDKEWERERKSLFRRMEP